MKLYLIDKIEYKSIPFKKFIIFPRKMKDTGGWVWMRYVWCYIWDDGDYYGPPMRHYSEKRPRMVIKRECPSEYAISAFTFGDISKDFMDDLIERCSDKIAEYRTENYAL